MPNLILLFNHCLTKAQELDAHLSLRVESIIEPPPDIGTLWAQVPPDIDDLGTYLEPIFLWLESEARPGDYVLVQGEFGATWLAVQEAFRANMIPVYSTTRRDAMEEHMFDGRVETRHIFSHVRYRRYST
ncbi:MAG: CRISPR-associated protein Csx20 [Desulfocapsaceae bacterium]|nr:CRISPR-associated protein Csx20 [Desulfocapsaceae bacterium]